MRFNGVKIDYELMALGFIANERGVDGISRADLVDLLHTSSATVSGVVDKLIRAGFVIEGKDSTRQKPGRRPISLLITEAGSRIQQTDVSWKLGLLLVQERAPTTMSFLEVLVAGLESLHAQRTAHGQ